MSLTDARANELNRNKMPALCFPFTILSRKVGVLDSSLPQTFLEHLGWRRCHVRLLIVKGL